MAELPYDKLIDYQGGDNAIYLGWAKPGSGEAEAEWLIIKCNYDGNDLISKQYASGTKKYDKIWDNRDSYDYTGYFEYYEWSAGLPIYCGFADPSQGNVLITEALWQIYKLTYSDSKPTSKKYADGTNGYVKVWDDRATYSY